MFKRGARLQDGLRGSHPARALEDEPDTFFSEKRLRIEPSGAPKFRIQVKVGRPRKGQRKTRRM